MTLVRVVRAFGGALACTAILASCSGEPSDSAAISNGAEEGESSVSSPTSGGRVRGGVKAGGSTSSPSPSDDEAEPQGEPETVARFTVTVDPTGKEPLRFEPVEASATDFGTKATSPLPAGNSVLNNVSLSGPGTWHPATQTLEATVVLTHVGGSGLNANRNFNEPQLVVTSLSDTTGTVTFESTDNPGVTGVGATFAFADIQRPIGAVNRCGAFGVRTSATHRFVIRDTIPATSFQFTVDVRALPVQNNNGIFPDCDGDGNNTEDGDAGLDCNDQDPAVNQGNCDCNSCTTAGATCSETLTSGAFNCAGHPCSCNIDATGGEDVHAITCRRDCNVTCDGTSDGDDTGTVACRANCLGTAGANPTPATCSMACSNTVSGLCDQSCLNGSACSFSCSGVNASHCRILDCGGGTNGGSSCAATCEGSGTTCGVNRCADESFCDVTCGTAATPSSFSNHCGINFCEGGSTCLVACTNAGTRGCRLNCEASAGLCRMDCSAIPPANRAARCGLVCAVGTPTDVGGGFYECR